MTARQTKIPESRLAEADGNIDLIIRRVRLTEGGPLLDLGLARDKIAVIARDIRCDDAEVFDAGGAFAFGGYAESHIHLDKACILDRCAICDGTLAEAVRQTAQAKASFTQDDVYERARSVIEKSICHGTTRMRTFVEIDPRAGFRSFEALKRLRSDLRFAIDLQICAFVQEGLTHEPATLDMLDAALGDGADMIGGCPYTDPEPAKHIAMIFDLAAKHDVNADFHLDFDLSPTNTNLPEVLRSTVERGWSGRVSIGHVTNLSAMAPSQVVSIAKQLQAAGVALTALPATDLFLNGRGQDRLVPRGIAPAHILAEHGVTTTVATNNVLNPFTPYGDASLIRMANLFANTAQLARAEEMEMVFDMVSRNAARMMGFDSNLVVGGDATIVLLDCNGPQSAVRSVATPIAAWKNGRQTLLNERPKILYPSGSNGAGAGL